MNPDAIEAVKERDEAQSSAMHWHGVLLAAVEEFERRAEGYAAETGIGDAYRDAANYLREQLGGGGGSAGGLERPSRETRVVRDNAPTGAASTSSPGLTPCERCKGTGRLVASRPGGNPATYDCPACNGTRGAVGDDHAPQVESERASEPGITCVPASEPGASGVNPVSGSDRAPEWDLDDPKDYAAFQLYAAGPWGEMDRFLDDGARVSTDSHSPGIYRAIVDEVVRIVDQHRELAEPEPVSQPKED